MLILFYNLLCKIFLECDSIWSRLKPACQDLTQFSRVCFTCSFLFGRCFLSLLISFYSVYLFYIIFKWCTIQLQYSYDLFPFQLLSEKKGKFERFNTVAKMKLKMQENELQRTLFSKRKLPSSFDSILATPRKELKLDETVTDSDNNILSTTWSNQQNERLKSLKGCERKKSPDQNLEV